MKLFNRIVGITLCLASLLSVTSCKEEDEFNYTPRPKKERHDIPLTRSQQEIVSNHSNFAFKMFKELNALYSEQPTTNIVISPLSMSIALSMMANAVGEDDYAAMLEMMGLEPSTSVDELNTLSRLLVDELLDVDSQIDLKIANSIWTNNSLTVKGDFMKEVSDYYDAPCLSVEQNKKTESVINNWVSEATNGYINRIHSSTGHFWTKICNATYFNGEWNSLFNHNLTEKGYFTSIDQKKSKVYMMNGLPLARTAETDDLTIVGIPFGNMAYWIYFVIPNKSEDMDKIIANLNYTEWVDNKPYLSPHDIDLTLPRFDFDFTLLGADILRNMGFDFGSNSSMRLPNMLEDNPSLDGGVFGFSQVCNIKLAENGAVTSVAQEIEPGLYVSNYHEKAKIDRPFMFFIEEESTGAILIMGKVVKL